MNSAEEVEALVRKGDPAAAERLRALGESADRALAKQARKGLHLLKLAGIEPPGAAAPGAIPPTGTRATVAERALMTNVGGDGRQMLLFVREDPYGGSPSLITVLVSDEEGIVDVAGAKLSRRELDERLSAWRERPHSVLAETPIDYVRCLLQDAMHLGEELRRPLPRGFSHWAHYIGSCETPPSRPLVYQYIDSEVLSADTSLDRAPETLLQKQPFVGWILRPQDVEPWEVRFFETQQTPLALDPGQLAQRGDKVIDEATDALLTAVDIERWRKRLEITALALYLDGRIAEARQALAIATQTNGDREPHEVPFARALVHRSIFVVIALKARREEEDEAKTNAAQPPSPIIHAS